jgi:hypothetical protein
MTSPKAFAATTEVLDFAIGKLRVGLFAQLDRRYSATYGQEANFLSAAVLNEALAEEPPHENARKFKVAQRNLISEEVRRQHALPETAKPLSYLYTAQIPYLTLRGAGAVGALGAH